MVARIAILTAAALAAFAANSILCRLALAGELIDPIAFTTIRLGAGALVLLPILLSRPSATPPPRARTLASAAALFVYAHAFSLAYVGLDAGTGALILFAAVQLTMIAVGLARGARPAALEWAGATVALAGLVYLVAPGLHAPPAARALAMAAAGAAWGAYSLLGKAAGDPVAATARNFVWTLPLAGMLALAAAARLEASTAGIALAVASGAITSGLGYVAWYAALRHLSAMAAPVVQLAVPVIAAAGGIALLNEALTTRLVVASALILGGVFLTLRSGRRQAVSARRA